MTGNLDEVLKSLITEALPGLVGGTAPPVQLSLASELFTLDAQSADAMASAPRPDDRTDTFPLAANPVGPYTLTQSPYPGPRRVRLTTTAGDRIPLRDDEVLWDTLDSRKFSLNPRSSRNVTGITGVQVLYGVTAIFIKIKALQSLTLQLQAADANQLEQAEALVIAVIELNRQHLVDTVQATYANGDYSANLTIKSLTLLKGARTADDKRLLTLEADTELKATRTLREEEGKPIERILTPGQSVSARHPVNIDIAVES